MSPKRRRTVGYKIGFVPYASKTIGEAKKPVAPRLLSSDFCPRIFASTNRNLDQKRGEKRPVS